MTTTDLKEIAKMWTNTTLKTLVNVYQLQFATFKPPGLGDYLRGCFSMMQYIRMLNTYCGTNLTFEMDLRNHPMSNYMVDVCTVPKPAYSTLGEYKIDAIITDKNDPEDPTYHYMLRSIIEATNPIRGEIYYGFCCKFEMFDEIDPVDKAFMRSRFAPNEAMTAYLESAIDELGLRNTHYTVIHVRCHDLMSFSSPPCKLSQTFFERLDALLAQHVQSAGSGMKYLILSSHNEVKEHLKGRGFYMRMGSKICHLGLTTDQTADATRDTMLDFYLMSRASHIIGFTPYGVSGFGQECAKLYDIPHTFVNVPLDFEPAVKSPMPQRPMSILKQLSKSQRMQLGHFQISQIAKYINRGIDAI